MATDEVKIECPQCHCRFDVLTSVEQPAQRAFCPDCGQPVDKERNPMQRMGDYKCKCGCWFNISSTSRPMYAGSLK
jgi:uncharacterized paraquat-inducible protein A